MLENAAGINRVIVACGYVDMRKGVDGLAQIIESDNSSALHEIYSYLGMNLTCR